MRVKYSMTFEFETRQPVTHRGVVKAVTPETCMARATREARAVLQPVNWTSAVCVLLERIPDATDKKEVEVEVEVEEEE